MELNLSVYSALCGTSTFLINGIVADYKDFGTKGDIDPDNAEPYGCGNMTFIPKPATNSVLEKYKITVDEYNKVARQLEDKLSFGRCGWCV